MDSVYGILIEADDEDVDATVGPPLDPMNKLNTGNGEDIFFSIFSYYSR